MDNVFIKKEELNKWVAKYFDKDLISIEDLIDVIGELDDDLENLQEKYDDLERDLEDNYRPISQAEQYGISDRDFY